MVQRRIGPADLVPGEPLPWDLFLADHSAGPQLRKGQIITDGAQQFAGDVAYVALGIVFAAQG